MDSESCAYLSFSLAPNIGPKTFLLLLHHFGSAENAWNGNETQLGKAGLGPKTLEGFLAFRKTFDVTDYEQKLTEKKVTFLPQNDSRYPKSLKQLENPPIGLFCKGNIELLSCHSCEGRNPGNATKDGDINTITNKQNPELDSRFHENDKKIISVVGTRKTTSYGKQVTEQLVEELASSGFTIVSGLALGVDAIAHKTALEHNGKTIAVLGCGVDCATPQENENLYDQILSSHSGSVISEYPLSEPPKPGTFPARNRIIAALSQATLVTEAAADSGSLITADWAQKLGKKVFAVPGPITSRQSDGTAYLLKRGAKFVTSGDDILDELNLKAQTREKKDFSRLNLSDDELKITQLLTNEPLSIDQIAKLTNIPVYWTSSLLSSLELKGIIKNQGNKIFGIS